VSVHTEGKAHSLSGRVLVLNGPAVRWSSRSAASEEEAANLELRLGRITGTAAEFTLLNFALTGSRTFFLMNGGDV